MLIRHSWMRKSQKADDIHSTVGGGLGNVSSGTAATVASGYGNRARGDFSFAAGRRAKANHQGTFVWADSTEADFASTAKNQFLVRASSGVGIDTMDPTAEFHA
jgi:hypothetical protein